MFDTYLLGVLLSAKKLLIFSQTHNKSMNISRRNFVKTGTVATFFAGTGLLAPILAAAQRKLSTSFAIPAQVSSDPLFSLTAADFQNFVGSEFTILNAASGANVAVLSNVTEIRRPVKTVRRFGSVFNRKTRGENFVLSFSLPADGFSQATYQLWHPNFGPFDLFLVPGKRENNQNLLHAVINRI